VHCSTSGNNCGPGRCAIFVTAHFHWFFVGLEFGTADAK
jgi:hypothetical protein